MPTASASGDTPCPAAAWPDSAPRLLQRDVPPRSAHALQQAGLSPLLARLLAARGVHSADELDDSLARLPAPDTLLGCGDAARLLADALAAGQRLCVVADYDCDGATACAVALRGLRLLGFAPAQLRYVVPDRARHGYGLSPTIVDLVLDGEADGAGPAAPAPAPSDADASQACASASPGTRRPVAPRPDILLTVDNGIASVEGVAHARARGLRVLVTDHHLPALDAQGQAQLPAADVIVNPNQPGCGFASRALAGVGVVFYVLLALRAELRARGAFDAAAQPRLDALLDLVALGTVADVVVLDALNRRLVAQGLKRVRAGRLQPGLAALYAAAGRRADQATAFDLGFALGPRINAAGRLSDMTLGIECLLTDDPARAQALAAQLDAINRQRREVEADMRAQADVLLDRQLAALAQAAAAQAQADGHLPGPDGGAGAGGAAAALPPALVLFDEQFHEGVVGIVAGRLKDRLHRPTFVLARGQDGLLKGSGRSIAGFHLRDALDWVSKREPGVLLRFGGHAMAAGCTLHAQALPRFARALQAVARQWLAPETLARQLATDGPLPLAEHSLATVDALEAQVWGQGFAPPLFCDAVQVLQQRLVGERHLKLRLRLLGPEAAALPPHDARVLREAIWFGHTEPLPERVRLAYRLSADEFQGQRRLQWLVEAAQPLAAA